MVFQGTIQALNCKAWEYLRINFNHDRRPLCRDCNPGYPEYETEIVTNTLPHK